MQEKYSAVPTGCWVWNANKTHNGYGQIYYKGSQSRAHRVMYELMHGTIPNGMVVCHSCDNPSCVNPKHLYLATQKENIADCMRKGRFLLAKNGSDQVGTNNHRSVLNDGDVRAIREEYKSGNVSRSVLAAKYGVTKSNIQAIIERRSWGHV